MASLGEATRRSFLARQVTAAGASLGPVNESAVALDYGAPEAELAAAADLALADLSPLARCGFKGAGTCAWLSGQGASLPARPNQAAQQANGALIARLGAEEALVLGSLDDDPGGFIAELGQAWAAAEVSPRGYPVPRQDSHAWLRLCGRQVPALFAKLCAVDLRAEKFADLSIAQTSVARLSAVVIRADLGHSLAYHLLADSASAGYLWTCLLDAMAEFDGRPVGLTTLRALARG